MMATLGRLAWPRGPGAFRLWLALLVVFHHVTRVEVGMAPVLVFFMLSGFWVYRVWHVRYVATRNPWVTFVVSRWWRIAPLLMLASVLGFAAQYVTGDAGWPIARAMPLREALSAIFALGYADLPQRAVGPGWSLDIEMQFYLLAPLLVALVSRVSASMALALGLTGTCLAIVGGAGLSFGSFAFVFVLGMVAARHEWQAGMALGSLGLLAAVLAVVAAQMVRPWADIWDGDGKRAAFNIVLAVLMAPCALATARRKTDATDAVMGDQSYLVYILHWPFVTLLRAWAPGLWGFVAGGGVLVALCLAAWRWVDRPLEGMRRAWVAGRGRAGEAGEAAKKDDSAAILA